MLIVVGLLVLAPLCALVVGALSTDVPNDPNSEWTLSKVTEVFGGLVSGGTVQEYTIHSLALAIPVTILSTSVGALLAWLFTRTNMPGRRFFSVAFLVPMFYSVLVGVIGWVVLAEGQSGLINQLFRLLTRQQQPLVDVYSFGGIVWVMFLFFLPFGLIFNLGTFEAIDPALEEAGAVSGAGLRRRITHITLPLVLPSIAASALFIFVLAMEHFAIPGFLGSHSRFGTLAYAIYLRVNAYPNDPPLAAALGSLLILMTTTGLLIYRRLTRRAERFVTVSGKGRRSELVDLKSWRYVAFSFSALLLTVGVALPLVGVVLRALMPVRTTSLKLSDFGFYNFAELFKTADFGAAIQTSMILSLLGATICGILGLVLAYWIVRRQSRTTSTADYLISMPLGIPGTAFGVGMLWAFVATPLYLTIWIMLLAFIIRYAVYGVRMVSTGMFQIDPSLEEAAMVSGANPLISFMRVNLPLLKGSLASVWVIVFLLVMQELSASIMLYGVSTKTLPILTWGYLNDGFFGAASALALIQLALVTTVVVVFRGVLRVNVRPGVEA